MLNYYPNVPITNIEKLRATESDFSFNARGRGGGGTRTPLYKLYRYVTPHRVKFLARFGPKTGMVFGGTTGRCMNVFIVSIPKRVRKKEKCVNSKWI